MPEPALTSRANMAGEDPAQVREREGIAADSQVHKRSSHRDRQVVFVGKTGQGGAGGTEGLVGWVTGSAGEPWPT